MPTQSSDRLSESELATICADAVTRTCPLDTVVRSEGDATNSPQVVVCGRVRIFLAGPAGRKIVLDQGAARNCAKALQIRTLGTVGVILLAKRRGLIDSATLAITKISDAGCWLSADLVHTAMLEAGEA